MTPTPQCQSFSNHISHCSPIDYKPNRSRWLQEQVHQFKQLLQRLVVDRHEPKVWQKFDHQHNSLGWRVFDPETGRTIAFGSDLEVRLWLEQRFYHSHSPY